MSISIYFLALLYIEYVDLLRVSRKDSGLQVTDKTGRKNIYKENPFFFLLQTIFREELNNEIYVKCGNNIFVGFCSLEWAQKEDLLLTSCWGRGDEISKGLIKL